MKLINLSEIKLRIRHLLDLATIDRPVLFGILTQMWVFIAGPVSLILIASRFSPVLQGYYYTFGSVIALQVFAEMGLSRVILQFASHEWANLKLNNQGQIIGNENALSRLASLIRTSLRWYIIAGCILALGLGLGGYLFFAQSPDIGINWAMPWVALCLLTALNFLLLPFWSLLEGCNQLRELYFFRLIRGIIYSISIWVAIIFGAELWTVGVALMAQFAWGVLFLRKKYWKFINQLFYYASGPSIDWMIDIWPMQWRIALSWISSIFTSLLYVPVLFHFHGVVAAGKMGMTWNIVMLIGIFASVLVLPKSSIFGILVAKKDYKALDRIFLRVTFALFGLVSLMAAALMAVILLLFAIKHPFSSRILPPLPSGLFILAMTLRQLISPQVVYLQAHRKEPLFGLSVGNGILVGLCTLIFGSRYGATAIAIGDLAVTVFFVIPFATIIWYRCRKEWHSDAS